MTAAHAPRSVRSRALTASIGGIVSIAIAVGVAGCTGSSSSTASSSVSEAGPAVAAGVTSAAAAATSAAAAASAAAAPAATQAAAAATSGAAAAPTSTGPLEGRPAFNADPNPGRSVIYTATVNLEVATAALVATQADQAARLAQAANGFVFSRNQAAAAATPAPVPSGQPVPPASVASADLVIKVPPATYGSLLNELDQLGKDLDVNETSQDVTNQVVDVQARLTSYRASVARVRILLSKATTIGQIVEVEGELTRREADLESMEGQLAVLKSQTAFATITLHLQQKAPAVKVVVPPAPKPPKPPIHGFVSGLKAGGRGFATVAIGIATVLGAVLPFLGVLVVVALLAWWGRRHWLRRSHPQARTEQAAL
ncbi:hypothetical protein acdb102_45350 [Acidothermaceae bacterium B102]|nr:hypothetical protein acdb102_45350 [Acidothermaceae bacterium B102]